MGNDPEKIRKVLRALGFYDGGVTAEFHQFANQLSKEDLHAITRLGMALANLPGVTNLPAEELSYLKVLSETGGEPIEEPDYLKLLDEIRGKVIDEPNYLNLLGDSE